MTTQDSRPDRIVGIDLGTTNSLIGSLDGGLPKLVVDARGSSLLPSVVGVLEGRVVVGRAAKNQRLLNPTGTVAGSKRQMGSTHEYQLGDRRVSATQVAAFILAELLDRAEREYGSRPGRAIITVPAFFKDAQRQATRDAGELAGLHIERLVNEPTAAALNYETGGESTALVYDFGGGTFDVSILDREQGFLEVRSSHGDTQLGGADIDAALVEHVLGRLGSAAAQVRRDPRAMTRLTEAVERAKMALSDKLEVQLVEPFLAGDGQDVVNVDLLLTRDHIAPIVEPFVLRTLSCIDRALADAKLEKDALDRVILVGGSSKIPYVQQRVAEHLDLPPLVDEQADVAVALGAVRLAGRAEGLGVDDVLVDISPHTLAVGALSYDVPDLVASAVIERMSVVPCTVRKTYYTVQADQTAVEVPVVQGEQPLAADNTPLGMVRVEDLPPGPAQSPVDVEFRLDLSGVLHVSATHVASGKQASARIADSPYRLTKQQRKAATATLNELRSANADLPAESLDQPASLALGQVEATLARALLERAEHVLRTKESSADPDALAKLRRAESNLRRALDSSETPDWGSLTDDLSDALLDLT